MTKHLAHFLSGHRVYFQSEQASREGKRHFRWGEKHYNRDVCLQISPGIWILTIMKIGRFSTELWKIKRVTFLWNTVYIVRIS